MTGYQKKVTRWVTTVLGEYQGEYNHQQNKQDKQCHDEYKGKY